MNNHNVAIIIINWNSYQDTFECLESLEKLTYKNFRVFLVDNGSYDDSLSRLKYDFKNKKIDIPLTFLETNKNLGFAGGNNYAIKHILRRDYGFIWLLNNDTLVDRNSLTHLINTASKDNTIGIVGSKIYYYRTNIIWFAGGLVNRWTGKTRHLGWKRKDIVKGQYDKKSEVDYITGCSMLIKRKVIESIGQMSEDYFLYFEETEFNLRAQETGWRIIFEPRSVIYHKVSMSSGGEKNLSPKVTYYILRNRFWMIKRTQPSIRIITSFFYMFFASIKELMKIFLKGKNKKRERIKYIMKAIMDSGRKS